MKIIIILILLSLPISTSARSEITGYISTDPARPDEKIDSDQPTDSNTDEPSIPSTGSAGSGLLLPLNLGNLKVVIEEEVSEPESEAAPVVLGFDRLPSSTLVRDQNGRVYVIMDDIKKVIWDLRELARYQGEPILDLPDAELATYPTRRFHDQTLIRQIGTAPVYLVSRGQKIHIKTLVELRQKYSGWEIYNIKAKEFVLYK